MTTNAKVAAKGLKSTGVTEQVARKMHAHLGGHWMAVVELKVASRSEDDDGDEQVVLTLEQVEPIIDNPRLDEHLRQLARVLYATHGEDDQLAIDDQDPTPRIEDVVAEGEALLERDAAGEPTSVWDGETEPQAATHTGPRILDEDEQPAPVAP